MLASTSLLLKTAYLEARQQKYTRLVTTALSLGKLMSKWTKQMIIISTIKHSKHVLPLHSYSLISDSKAAPFKMSFLTILILDYCIFSFILVSLKYIERWRGCTVGPVTFFCMILSSSLRLMFTFINCWIFTSEATSAFLTCMYSWAVTGPSDKSESRLYEQKEKNTPLRNRLPKENRR